MPRAAGHPMNAPMIRKGERKSGLVSSRDSRDGAGGGFRKRIHGFVAAVIGALAVLILVPALAAAADAKLKVVPDRIDDVAPIAPERDPIPTFANFAWRAFIALNWPGFANPEQRGEVDRAKTLGDAGPRVWETWKSRHEVFQQDEAGYARVPAPWNST